MSDYSWIGPLIQAASQMVGGQQIAAGADQQNDLLRDAYKRALAMLQSGELNVNAQQAGAIGPTAMNGVAADPNSIIAQQQALSRLGEMSKSGFDAIDRAAMNRTLAEANANERSQREAALARLDPNSGAALAARMSAQQSSANRANQQALDVAAQGRLRALQALGQFGGLAGQMRQQSFGEGAARAKAADAIAQFNGETSRFNAGQGNQVGLANAGHKIDALKVAGGAGEGYGKGLANAGNIRGLSTAGVGNTLGNAFNASQSRPQSTGQTQGGGSNSSTTTPQQDQLYGDYVPPDEEDQGYA